MMCAALPSWISASSCIKKGKRIRWAFSLKESGRIKIYHSWWWIKCQKGVFSQWFTEFGGALAERSPRHRLHTSCSKTTRTITRSDAIPVSKFRFFGQPWHVTTTCDPSRDVHCSGDIHHLSLPGERWVKTTITVDSYVNLACKWRKYSCWFSMGSHPRLY